MNCIIIVSDLQREKGIIKVVNINAGSLNKKVNQVIIG